MKRLAAMALAVGTVATVIPVSTARAVDRGDCENYVELFQQYGLPVETFKAIAWRESGCNHLSWVNNRTDLGGGLLGINMKGRNMQRGWKAWCGGTPANITDPEVNVRCAAAAYQRMGLRPWRTGR
jgi:hypothetical protein